MVDVSIVIVNWNTSELLFQCLDSIRNSNSQYAIQVIVIDNGSVDESVFMVQKQFPEVTLIKNDCNMGFARANNQGLTLGDGRYFLLLNSDTIVRPGSIDKLVETADNFPDLGVVGPQLLNMDDTIQESWGSFPSLLSELIGKNFRVRYAVENVPNAYEVDWVLGACMLVRAKTAREVGQLDNDFFFYSEEIDWCFRIKKQTWRIWYITDAQIYHLGGGSTQIGSLAQLVRLYRGKLIYFQKHHGIFTATLLRFGLAFGNTFGVVRRILILNWIYQRAALQRIVNQSMLVWCLLWNRYPKVD
jgi:GT2 family glycosyltransferase